MFGDNLLEPPSHYHRRLALAVRENDDKLFPTPSGKKIALIEIAPDDPGQFLQNLIADQMPKTVVDGFKIVNIKHDHGQIPVGFGDTVRQSGIFLIKFGFVIDPGQGIGFGHFYQFNGMQILDSFIIIDTVRRNTA
ncbi:hypothetical protein DSECCO2_252650 [anaerobic digester metagenome]